MCHRCGDIFKAAFIARMSSFARQAGLSEQVQALLTTIYDEAVLGCVESTKPSCPDHSVQQSSVDGVEDATAAKRLRRSSSLQTLDNTGPVDIESGSFGDGVHDTSAVKCTSAFQTKNAKTLRPVMSPYSHGPMFYYCPHRRRLKNVDLPK